ncbi:MAG: 50S ribosomal protein L29 [Candidatus Micrarchaeota archaeon]|nr:50S ribosomal protein L29 [Candidatus Micrarchaeota archaeon]
MAVIRKKELKAMAVPALQAKLADVKRELNSERGLVASGGRSSNPGRIKELRRTVARILTFLGQKADMALPSKPSKLAASNKTPSGAGAAAKPAPAAKSAAPKPAKQ